MRNNINQPLNIPVFQIADTCENSSSNMIKDLNKKRNILSIFRRKKNQITLDNLQPIQIFQVDAKIKRQKQAEAEKLKNPEFSMEFLNWANNIKNTTTIKRNYNFKIIKILFV